ncbi:MAG: nucleotidyltransferase domain-containing protein [Nitrospirae bacterium]|nr:nucleotidyltransferase domain-containing protein [Nitrospirota bacterium]
MAKRAIIEKVRKYLHILRDNGFPVTSGILYGSYVRGEETPDSDIDVMVLSPLFDKDHRARVGQLWSLTRKVDNRIEPVPVGEERFKTDNVSPLLAIARQEGVMVRIRKKKLEKAG